MESEAYTTLKPMIPFRGDWLGFKTWLGDYLHGLAPQEPYFIHHQESLGEIRVKCESSLTVLDFLLHINDGWEVAQITCNPDHHPFAVQLVEALRAWAK